MKFLIVVTLLVCLTGMSQSMFNDYGFPYVDDNGLWMWKRGGRMSQFFRYKNKMNKTKYFKLRLSYEIS